MSNSLEGKHEDILLVRLQEYMGLEGVCCHHRLLFTCPSQTPPASKWDSLLQGPSLQEFSLILGAGEAGRGRVRGVSLNENGRGHWLTFPESHQGQFSTTLVKLFNQDMF